jgi:tripartite ATP-independent transporter DctM subunit
VALPYFGKTAYNKRLVFGSLAAGGALGNLIPPGISFIVYSLFTDTSIGKLYAGGFVVGILVAALFMVYIFGYGLVTGTREAVTAVTWRQRVASLAELAPTLALIFLVLGTIYLGLATATESAALGVIGALALAALDGRLRLGMVHASVRTTARSTSMIGLILIAAFALNFVLSGLRLPQALATTVAGLPLPPWATMTVIILLYIALGTFMDGFAIMVTTLPVLFPVVTALHYDPIWFGVIMTMLIEIAQITPPDGMVMYVLQGMRVPPGPISDVFVGVLPFLGIYALSLLLVTAFPGLVLWFVK